MSRLTNVIRAQQFDRDSIEQILTVAREMEKRLTTKDGTLIQELTGKILALLFYEPSTRTYFSFWSAMKRLGGDVIGTEHAGIFSSVVKGESLRDTIKIISGFADAIVLRHPDIGSAEEAAKASFNIPIINAGDGAGQHPTQALLDLYTIWKHFDRLDGLIVGMVGDLANGRTVRSLAYMLSKFKNIKLIFVAHPAIKMRDDIKLHLTEKQIPFTETENLGEIAPLVDVLYVTRVQKERFVDLAEYENVKGSYLVNLKIVGLMKPDAIIMHPLPRVDELPEEVDINPRAIYLEQARVNGLVTRMALLQMILKG